METIQLSTGAIFAKNRVRRVVRMTEPVAPVETATVTEAGNEPATTEREVLVVEMNEGPAERVEGEHVPVDAAKLEAAGFKISESL
ncbi:MAG: hypothetical protein JO108_03310 [Acidobacteriaceae bacterium]|nr:hypothetical protein [Acidobacteriaceae bacterium]